jgi:dimethylamine corrinoid protein
MIGGGPISQGFADKIGADLYTTNASNASKSAKALLNKIDKQSKEYYNEIKEV